MSDYNGWTNRETWLVNLWLGDDEYLQGKSADEIKDIVDDMMAEILPEHHGLMADMLQGALDAVDYRELAEHMAEE